jgi:hypothetical protein
MMAQSVYWLAMGWTVWGLNPGGARFSAPIQTGPGAHPASYTMGTGSYPGVKRPGRGIDHPAPSSAEVEGKVELYTYSLSGPSWPVIGWTLPFPYLCLFIKGYQFVTFYCSYLNVEPVFWKYVLLFFFRWRGYGNIRTLLGSYSDIHSTLVQNMKLAVPRGAPSEDCL